MNFFQISERLMEKRELRTRIGWVDWSSDSWDRRECDRRAIRIVLRAKGIRTDRRGNELEH